MTVSAYTIPSNFFTHTIAPSVFALKAVCRPQIAVKRFTYTGMADPLCLNTHANAEEYQLTVQTLLHLLARISCVFRLYIAIIRLNTKP
jgi:hypothetical protein